MQLLRTLGIMQQNISEAHAVEWLTHFAAGDLASDDNVKDMTIKVLTLATINYMEECKMLTSDEFNGLV
jgi:hypothetical protein